MKSGPCLIRAPNAEVGGEERIAIEFATVLEASGNMRVIEINQH
jgi:hypothetical protein